jgi:AraC-like DNA-binding protein
MRFYGLHRYQSGAPMPRHRHAEPYMAIVVEGGYLEAGDAGRFEARPGDVLLHGQYDAHRDAFDRSGSMVLNLPLEISTGSGFGRIGDVDAIVRLAERDPWQASAHARVELAQGRPLLGDWPDLLAGALRDDPSLRIACWAHRMGLGAASVSRGFAQAYGVSPKRFRLEARVRCAARRLPCWRGSFAALAAELGFADQAHMSRAIVAMTGHTPSALRAKSVQASTEQPR